MRLIDADLLLPQIGNRYDEKKDIVPDNLAEGFVQMEKLIKEQPTAYDVDKVVEQLEKLANEANDKILEAGGLQLYYDGYEDAMRTAVEIVKGGGADVN